MYKVSDVAELLFYVSSLSNLLRRVKPSCFSVVVLPGLFPENPVTEAFEIAIKINSPYLLVAGFHVDTAKRYEVFTDEIDCESCNIKLLIQDGFKDDVHNTMDQIRWLTPKINENSIDAVVLLSQSYHLPRAFATLIQSFINYDYDFIPIIPVSHAISPFERILWNHERVDLKKDSPQINLFKGEFSRLDQYSSYEKLDVSTIKTIRMYGEWLNENLNRFII